MFRGARTLGPALALLVAGLLFGCVWWYLRSGETALEPLGWSAAPGPALPAREGAAPDVAPAEQRAAERTPVAELEAAGRPTATEAVSARRETTVFGWLHDAARAPIQGVPAAGVALVDQHGERRELDARPEGAFTIRGLDFGAYRATASAFGYRDVEASILLSAESPVVRKDFVLQSAVALRITASTPDGKSLLDALKEVRAPLGARLLLPVATLQVPGERLEASSGNADDKFGVGRYSQHGPRGEAPPPGALGFLFVECDLPVYVSLVNHGVVLATQRVDAGQAAVDFVLSPDDLLAGLATFRVCVVDAETSLPIQRARVLLRGGAYSDPGAATDPRGVATLARREPGRFDLQIRAEGYEWFRKSIDAPPGATTDLGTVALEKAITIAGRVGTADGQPLAASFNLGIVDPLERTVQWFPGEEFSCPGDGALRITGLGRREYVLRTVNHDAVDAKAWEGTRWVSGNRWVDTRAGSVEDLDIRLCPATQLALTWTGPETAGMQFRVVDALGYDLVRGPLVRSWPRPLALPPGDYRVAVFGPGGGLLAERAVTLGTARIALELAP